MATAQHSAELNHAYGLVLVRQRKYREAVAALGRATSLAPDDPRYAYVYVRSRKPAARLRRSRCLSRLSAAIPRPRHPVRAGSDPSAAGDLTAALRHARALVRVAPDYPNARELLRSLDPNAG